MGTQPVGLVWRLDCCGTHARFSPVMFAGWARNPWVCPNAVNNERFQVVCISCSDYAAVNLYRHLFPTMYLLKGHTLGGSGGSAGRS